MIELIVAVDNCSVNKAKKESAAVIWQKFFRNQVLSCKRTGIRITIPAQSWKVRSSIAVVDRHEKKEDLYEAFF